MKRVRYNRSDKQIIKDIVAAGKHHVKEFGRGHGAYNAKMCPGTAKFLCRRGATIAELADAFDVSTQTIGIWISKYPEFGDAVNIGAHEQFDPRVERSLAELALGYSVDVEESFIVDKELVTKTVRKHYPPNAAACIFFLKNRMREKYRDTQHHEVTSRELKSSDELRLDLIKEFKDLIDAGLIALPRKALKEINPKANGHE